MAHTDRPPPAGSGTHQGGEPTGDATAPRGSSPRGSRPETKDPTPPTVLGTPPGHLPPVDPGSPTTSYATRTPDGDRHSGGTHHCIGVVSRLTGIGLDTLRVWERRYGVPCPYRDATGARFYSEADIQHLRMVGQALRAGYRPRDVLRLSENAIRDLLSEVSLPPSAASNVGAPSERTIEELYRLVERAELLPLRGELRRIASAQGTRRFASTILAPLIERTAAAWEEGKAELFHVRFLAELVTAEVRFHAGLLAPATGPVALLAALPHEQHQLPLDLIGLVLSGSGLIVHSLGTNMAVAEIAKAARAVKAQVIGVSATLCLSPTTLQDQLIELADTIPPTTELWAGGRATETLADLPKRVQILSGWDELDAATTGVRLGH